MKLFFETANQAACFLISCGLGFVLAVLLDGNRIGFVIRLLLDLLAFLAAGFGLLLLLLFFSSAGLRGYHLLGLLIGAFLYMKGVRSIVRWIQYSLKKRRQICTASGGV